MFNFLKRNLIWVLAAVLAIVAISLVTSRADAAEPDRAPIAVTQERLLDVGEVETFYSYSNRKFNGNVTSNHDFGAMLGLTDFLTVGASTYYADTANSRVGDFFVFGTLDAGDLFGFEVRPSLGVSIPNGFNAADPTLQFVSSGSTDLQPAVSVIGNVGPLGVGAQYVGVFRLDNAPNGLTLGDENTLKAWASSTMFNNVVVYAAAEAAFVESGTGFAFDTGSEAVLLGAGARTTLAGFELSGEAFFPVYEDYDSLAAFNEQRVFRLGVQRSF